MTLRLPRLRPTARSLCGTAHLLRRPQGRRAFTLIEILVVMGIIVLLLAMALPAFRFITGSRSAEAASNQIAAVLSVARAQAIGIQQTRGVAIYRDPDNDRSVAALVEVRSGPLTPFVSGTNPINYVRGQYYYTGTFANPVAYVCIESYLSTSTLNDPVVAGNNFWRRMSSMDVLANQSASYIELLPNSEFASLPIGIDARGVANQIRFPNNSLTSTDPRYRYLSPAVVLFDKNGQIVSQPYCISRQGLLGAVIEQAGAFIPGPVTSPVQYAYGASPVPAQPAPNPTNINTASQVGLVLYDSEIFKNAVGAGTADEQANWLDQNATPSMINRFNGTLVKGD